ncbi:hypothetical protein B0H11DRAFT_1736622 [Mycena galericulata]|nr:hypothetical protein B0H11DRAFT_1736622 [Mycena galericulata]
MPFPNSCRFDDFSLYGAQLPLDHGLSPAYLTESVISGSTAAILLTEADFTAKDLDLYVPEAHEIRMLYVFQNHLGFTLDRTQTSTYPSTIGEVRIHWLEAGEHFVNLIVMEGDNAAKAIFQFHSTFVMNFIAWHGVYCAYPDLTLNLIGIINRSQIVDNRSAARMLDALEKYARRGVTMCSSLRAIMQDTPHVCGEHKLCTQTVRSVRDTGGLFVPFNPGVK